MRREGCDRRDRRDRREHRDGRDDDPPSFAQRWVLSWSDFVTLLLVVFAAMYANARSTPEKYRVRSEEVPAVFDQDLKNTHTATALAEAFSLALRDEIAGKTGADKTSAHIITINNGVLLDLDAKLLFASGDADLSPALIPVLKAIALVLKTNAYRVVIEGYADSQPISNRRFPSNWELSAARAASVARFFAEHGVNEERLEIIGQGTNLALSANDTPEGRQGNRRVRIQVRMAADS